MKYYEVNRIRISILLFFCSFIFLVVTGCDRSSLRRTSFSQYSIGGFWKMIAFGGEERYRPFNIHGSLVVSDSGNVTEGNLAQFGVHSKIASGGKVSTTGAGTVTGSIGFFLDDTNTHSKYRILGGQMPFSKDVIVYAGNFHRSSGVGILVKKSGSFTGPDLEGTWVFPLGGIFSVSVGNAGAITGCSSLSNKGKPGTCSGTFSITPQGAVAGQIKAVNGKTFKIKFAGQMNSRKDMMIFAGGISTGFYGVATFAIKRDGAFSLSDGQGNWKIFITGKTDAIYGTATFEDSGKVTGGNWTGVEKNSGTFTGGTLSISKGGDVSGFINTSSGNTYTILGGQMSPNKDFTGGIQKDNSGRFGVMILVKPPDYQTRPAG